MINTASLQPAGTRIDRSMDSVAGGHHQNFCLLGDQIVKITNVREAQVYSDYGSKLIGAIPKSTTLSKNFIDNLSDNNRNKLLTMRPTLDDEVPLVLERVGGINKESEIEFDIKIGKSTASKTELENCGHPHPLQKKLKMTISDYATNSRSFVDDSRGYRIIGTKVYGVSPNQSRLSMGTASNDIMRNHLSGDKKEGIRQKLLSDIENIKDKVNDSGVTFIASSILLVIDENNTENTKARLIDLAHPVKDSDSNYSSKLEQFNSGVDNLISTIDNIT